MKHIKWLPLVALLALLVASCEEEDRGHAHDITFNATIEQFANSADSQKIVLINEEWIYWELGDEVSIASDRFTEGYMGRGILVNTTPGSDFEDFNGVFVASLPENSKYFLGLHPYNADNHAVATSGSSAFSSITVNLAAEQPLRHDSSFSRKIFPMVAWYGGTWSDDPYTPFNLDFHNLAAIVRIQLFNQTGSDATISRIAFSSTDGKKLSGAFTVNDYNTEEPYLSGGSGEAVAITCGDGLAFPAGELKTFYLVLPAFGGRSVTTTYRLSMDVETTTGGHCIKTFTVPTRRTGVTYMNALGISSWESGGTASAGLVGNGTATRPFKVYTAADLCYLRDCYNSAHRTINGQPITADTYIRIMRSDITLTSVNWMEGIRNFTGHFSSVAAGSNPGITNRSSQAPLFESVTAEGIVENITLKSAHTLGSTNESGLSSFCYQNAGTIRNCVISVDPATPSAFVISSFSSYAGICVSNNGTIDGCRCEANIEVQSGKDFAGICLHNSNIIKGCQITAATVSFASTSSKAAGICFENLAGGTVRDCYFANSITGSAVDWAGIVYENSGTVEHCYLSSTGHIYTSKNVGGIVNTNKGASSKVDYCWLEGQLRGSKVGGIVDSLAAGTVINCYSSGGSAIITVSNASDVAGGIVSRMSGGTIANSFADFAIVRTNVNATVGGLVGRVSGGSCNNCYALEEHHLFYGTSSVAASAYTRCYLVDGTQTGVTTVSSAATNAYVTLQDDLNASGMPEGGKSWTGAVTNTTPPHLATYTVSGKRF